MNRKKAATSARSMAVLLGIAGVAHFVFPSFFERIVPPQLGHERELVLASGAAELLCAISLLNGKTRRKGALAAAVLFVAVFPANVYMALEPDATDVPPLISWLRLPLQPLLIWWAISIFRKGD